MRFGQGFTLDPTRGACGTQPNPVYAFEGATFRYETGMEGEGKSKGRGRGWKFFFRKKYWKVGVGGTKVEVHKLSQRHWRTIGHVQSTGHTCRKLVEVRNRQTDRQTRSSQYFAAVPRAE